MDLSANNKADPYAVIYDALQKMVDRFREQPLDAQYESDNRSYLFVRIFDAFKKYRIDLKDRLNKADLEYTGDFKVKIVRTEYPPSTEFDIALRRSRCALSPKINIGCAAYVR